MPSINPSVTVQATNVRAQTFVEETDSAPKTKITHIAADLADSPGKTAGAEEAPTLKTTPAEVRKNLKRVLDSLPLDISAILAVVRKNAQEIRKANVLVRDMASTAQFNELNKSAGDMQTAATFRLAAGLIQSTVQVGMASAQIISSVQAGKVAAEGIEPQKQAQQLQKQAADLNVTATQLESQALDTRSAPPAVTNDTVNAADSIANTVEEEIATTGQALKDKGQQSVNQEQVQQEIASKEQSNIKADFDVMSKDEVLDGPRETVPATIPQAAPKTPEHLETDAKGLRSSAADLKAQADVKLEEVKSINARADGIRSSWDLGSKLLDALLGQTSIAGTKFGAEIYDIRSKEHEVKAKQYESESARANDGIQAATEIGRDALQKLDSIEQARNQTNRSIQQNMG